MTAATTTGAEARRARLGHYAYWQIRDYLRERGAATLIVTLLFGVLGLGPIRAAIRANAASVSAADIAMHGSAEAARAAFAHEASATFVHSFIGAVVFLGALLAMNGIVANDRKLGYYRFLFSKPLSPARYYAQAFAVNSAGYLILLSLLALVYGWYVTPVLTPGFLAGVTAVFLMYASVAFLLSAAARWDWLSLVAATVAASTLWEKFGASSSPLAVLLYLLPPVHKTEQIYRAVADGTALPSHTLAWVSGYAALCFAAALLVLRRRRLAII